MSTVRVTLTLDQQLIEEVRVVSGGNFSRFVSRLLEERLAELSRQRLRNELRAGYEAEAFHDLEMAGEYRSIDDEMAKREEV